MATKTRYTVRMSFKINGTRRSLQTFIRPESALNTSSHATRFATVEEAQCAADETAERRVCR